MSNKTHLENIWQDLFSWQKEIKTKDETLNRRKPVHDQALPPIKPTTEIVLDNLNPMGLKYLSENKRASSETNLQTRAQKAEAEKAKGNEYFVKKDYKNAILYYTKAIDLDPTIAVYFVNRAMAHLKLNNFLEAEKDCSRGIQLEPKNVKALWRRGVALVGLGRINEARRDFETGLVVDPNNKSILDELKKLPKVADKKPEVVRPKKVEPEKRRLSINVIDEAYQPKETSPKLKSKEPIKPKESAPEPVKKQIKVQEPVKVQEPTKVQKPAKTLELEKPKEVKKEIKPTPLKINIPKTNFEFERDWKTFKGRGEDELYRYFQSIPPSSYTTIFKSSLESDQFEKMIDLVETRYRKEKTNVDIFNVLEGLSQVKRIDMLVMFLSKKEQQVLQSLFNLLLTDNNIPKDKLVKLSKIYSVRI